MKLCTFPDGTSVPALGQGTWQMGRDAGQRRREADALRHGLDLGMNLIDTAEMYADAELVVADALRGRSDRAVIVSKVLPGNSSYRGTMSACEKSLRRLQVDCIDVYLLHWRGGTPLAETLEAFVDLRDQGKIRRYGVSNFDAGDMEEAWGLPGGQGIATNQVLYNLERRGIEWSLVPWCKGNRVPIMAYSPLNQGVLDPGPLQAVAEKHGVNHFQVALAWLLTRDNVMVIPKAATTAHVEENHVATKIALDDRDLEMIDAGFPPPGRATPLDII